MATRQLPVTGEFTLARPETLEEVAALLREHGEDAALLSGGTDLLVQLRSGKRTPSLVIDLKGVRSLSSEIREEDGALVIGSLAVLADIILDERVAASFPVLLEAAGTVGSVQIRNRATLAGNICNASPAADTVPALLVHGALVELASGSDTRSLPLESFFLAPGKTARHSEEVLTSVRLPKPREATGAAFERLTRRRGVDLATINVACLVTDSGTTRFAFGAVGPRPILVEDESGRLCDPALERREQERLIATLLEHTSPISDVRATKEYRSAMLTVLTRRTLQRAIERLHGAGHHDPGA